MSKRKPEPFDHTVIIPGVPEMPADATVVLPVNPPRPEAAVSQPVPGLRRKRLVFALGAAILLLLTGGMTWRFLGGEASTPKAAMAAAGSVPPSLQGYLDAANQGDAKAMRMLGASYTYGLGVRANKPEGAAWYHKAAEAGDRMATEELAAVGDQRP